mmetsp:Transcript_17857/g.41248  ORF Transcript_17857/g.41248 Transcript_17857/m.41248 type:complete len:239 (-) Transcript_17857:732-1448(-)
MAFSTTCSTLTLNSYVPAESTTSWVTTVPVISCTHLAVLSLESQSMLFRWSTKRQPRVASKPACGNLTDLSGWSPSIISHSWPSSRKEMPNLKVPVRPTSWNETPSFTNLAVPFSTSTPRTSPALIATALAVALPSCIMHPPSAVQAAPMVPLYRMCPMGWLACTPFASSSTTPHTNGLLLSSISLTLKVKEPAALHTSWVRRVACLSVTDLALLSLASTSKIILFTSRQKRQPLASS